jgi:molybdenum cofactor cytidylyltransferase
MGRPKLLLPLDGQPLIQHTIAAWQRSRVTAVVAVVRPDDAELAAVVRASGAELVQPVPPPPDMKASIQAALRHLQRAWSPGDADAFLVAPADMPCLVPAMIDRLIAEHENASTAQLVAPSLAGQRGHPVLFPWTMADAVFALPADLGLDAIVRRQPPRLVPCDDLVPPGERPFADIDTPADYDRLQR